jgi:signal transduction histidine kinase
MNAPSPQHLLEQPPNRWSMSPQRQLALLLAVILCVQWLLVALNHQKVGEVAQKNLRAETAAITLAFAEHTDSTFQRVDYVLFRLRDAWVNQPETFGSAIAQHLILMDDAVLQVSIIDANGMLSFSSLGGKRIDLSDREHFKVHAQGSHADHLFLSRPVKGRASGKWSLQLTRPIFRQGQFAGVIVLSVDPAYFVSFYQKIDLGKHGLVSIVRDSGEIMAISIDMEQYLGKVINTAPFAAPGSASEGHFRGLSPTDGVDRIHAYFRLPDFGLTLIIGVGAEEHLELTRSQQRNVLWLASAASVLLLGMFWLVLRGMARRDEAKQLLLGQTQALTRANAELTRLGEAMAHHFQEPTRRLASFAQRLLTKSELVRDEDSRLSLHFIDSESKRLSTLVSDAQRYLSLDHTMVSTDESADSAAALRQCIKNAGAPAAAVSIELTAQLPRVKIGDQTLRTLFAVLLDNALRYRDPQRPLRIKVSSSNVGQRAVFRFADNGSGIAPEYRTQVLNLFTRLVPSTIPGTGMGLALAHKIVALAGGRLYVDDGLEGGTCIVFDLPLEIAA